MGNSFCDRIKDIDEFNLHLNALSDLHPWISEVALGIPIEQFPSERGISAGATEKLKIVASFLNSKSSALCALLKKNTEGPFMQMVDYYEECCAYRASHLYSDGDNSGGGIYGAQAIDCEKKLIESFFITDMAPLVEISELFNTFTLKQYNYTNDVQKMVHSSFLLAKNVLAAKKRFSVVLNK